MGAQGGYEVFRSHKLITMPYEYTDTRACKGKEMGGKQRGKMTSSPGSVKLYMIVS